MRFLSRHVVAVLLIPSAFGADPSTIATWNRLRRQVRDVEARLALATPPPLAPEAGVPDVGFADFFLPIGDRGLEYSPALMALAGKRIRIAGYMVHDIRRASGLFLMIARPPTSTLQDTCLLPELPPATVYVHTSPSERATTIPYQPGRIVVTGVLEIGNRLERDGRNSSVRLLLDSPFLPTAISTTTPVDIR